MSQGHVSHDATDYMLHFYTAESDVCFSEKCCLISYISKEYNLTEKSCVYTIQKLLIIHTKKDEEEDTREKSYEHSTDKLEK
jgi:hypothetical protein